MSSETERVTEPREVAVSLKVLNGPYVLCPSLIHWVVPLNLPGRTPGPALLPLWAGKAEEVL